MEIFQENGIDFLTRYAHVISGITWIGLLYYFNFVQTPAFAAFEPGPRNEAFAKLVPRAMWWFRWAAASTLAFGLLLFALGQGDGKIFDDMKSIQTMSILAGMLFGIVMFSNVWMVIWPAQRRAITNATNVLAGQEADAGLPPVMRKAACASRTNTLLSVPMLFFMVATSHFYPLSGAFDSSKGGSRIIWYLVILVIAVLVEVNVMRAPAVGKPEAWYIDTHKNTIIAGFVLTVVLYAVTEILFG